jgi:hypothetical protein
MRRLATNIGLALVLVFAGNVTAAAQAVPAALLLYPNYRGLIFSDRPEIVVEAPNGASVVLRDKVNGSTVATAQVSASRARIAAQGLAQDHSYTVVVQQGGSVIGQWDVTPVPSVRRNSMNVSFDAKGRLLMHGKPRFALGVYDSGLGYSNDPAAWEQMLFSPTGSRQLGGIPLNMYLNYYYGQAPLSSMNALMSTLQNHGMMYLQTGNCFAGGSHTRYPFLMDTTDTYPTQFAQHPGAAGFYIADECTDAMIPETLTHHERLKRLAPGTMTLNVLLAKGYIDPRKWVESADVLGTDPYPLFGPEPAQGYAHFQVADFVAVTKHAYRDTRPVFSVLQFFKFTTDSRWPTFAEERAHAVMSIVEGAKGIFWWALGPAGLRKSDAATVGAEMANLKSLVTELAALEPALIADDAPGALVGNSSRYADVLAGRKAQLEHNIVTDWLYSDKTWYREELSRLNAGDLSNSPMLPGAASIRTKTKVVNGKGYVFAYNYTNKSTPVTLTWYQAPGTVKENRSGNTYPVSGASWSDTFGPYESRIYVIANGGGTVPAPDPDPTPDPGSTPSPVAASITGVTNGSTVSGTKGVTLSATGGTPPYTYKLEVSGTLITGNNGVFAWDTTKVANGTHTLKATATDSAKVASPAVSAQVTVSNTTPAPEATPTPNPGFTASISYPAAGATVRGTIRAGMATTATWGKPKTFTLSVDGKQIVSKTITGTTLWEPWDSRMIADGQRTLTFAVSYNGATATTTRTVTVANGSTTPPPPPATTLTASISSPAAGATVSGTVTVGMASSGGSTTTARTYTLELVKSDGTTVPLTSSGATAGTLSYAWDTKSAATGVATLRLTVTQGSSTALASRAVTVSTTATATPSFTVSFSYPAEAAKVSGTQSVGMSTTATWGKAKTITLKVDGQVITSQTMTGTTLWYYWNTRTTGNGPRVLEVSVTYEGGTATATRTVTIQN